MRQFGQETNKGIVTKAINWIKNNLVKGLGITAGLLALGGIATAKTNTNAEEISKNLNALGIEQTTNFNKTIILIISLFFMISCSDKKNSIFPIGKWDDIIKLSTNNVAFSSGTDSVTITTEGDWWWIDGISFEDSTYSYYHRNDIDLESESYSIKEEIFFVERRDKNTLFVKIHENNTTNERIMKISLEAGDYFDNVTIKQAAK